MTGPVVDLNADLGEGFGAWSLGDDEALLSVITSANVACGFHAGDPPIMRRVCARAVDAGVAIGAQVSYRDLAGFGRRAMDVDPAELTDEILYQVAALDGFARIAGDQVRYVKPHGALYNRVVRDDEQAAAVVEAVTLYDRSLTVLGLPGSALLRLARDAGLTTAEEAFADRAYTAEGELVSRRLEGAVLQDAEEIARRCLTMVRDHEVRSTDGRAVTLHPRSVCVHGDTPGAVGIARRVRTTLEDAGIRLGAFA
jgi:UPF0271 protein